MSEPTYRQLDYWVRRGYLHPVGGVGHGNPRDWPLSELRVARAMAVLTEAGLTVKAAHDIARSRAAANELIRLVAEVAA